jgi:alpha-L-rhamnosidase
MRRWFLSAVLPGVMFGSATAQNAASIHLVEQAPVAINRIAPGLLLVDFGRVAFGNLSLTSANMNASEAVTVRFGEALKDGRVDTHPPGLEPVRTFI